jgi:hypothetical protein
MLATLLNRLRDFPHLALWISLFFLIAAWGIAMTYSVWSLFGPDPT